MNYEKYCQIHTLLRQGLFPRNFDPWQRWHLKRDSENYDYSGPDLYKDGKRVLHENNNIKALQQLHIDSDHSRR